MLEIYVTRHGETEWNTIRRLQGQLNSPLTELGESQGEWLGERLEGIKFESIYSSPLGRAYSTSLILNKYLNTTIIKDKRLMEIYLGDWEGSRIEVLEKTVSNNLYNFWNRPELFNFEGKEGFEDVANRAKAFLDEVVVKHKTGKVLIVAHAIIIKGIIKYVYGRSVEEFWKGKHIMPTSVTKIIYNNGVYTVECIGDTSHYKKPIKNGWFVDTVVESS